MSGVALDFQKVIDSGRDRKKNEALASKIFSKDRRKSAPGKLKPIAGPSLASRVGVKKNAPQRAISFGRRASVPSGNVNGDWTHDLHHTVSAGGKKNGGGRAITGSLAARISAPGSTSVTGKKAAKKQARIAAALDAMDVDGGKASQINIVRAAPSLTIKGLAGPFAIMGQNFAPGTSAADVESAMTPIGGEMVSCKLIKSQPFVLMEMVFASREGGERVIETFNNQTADGRVIKIYPKAGGYAAPTAASTQRTSSGRGQVVDGSHGFAENGSVVQAGNSRAGSGNLFSDKIVGKQGGRGGRGGRGRGRA